MTDDQLSEVFDLVEVHGLLTGGIVASGPWEAVAEPLDPFKFFAVMRGRVRATADGHDGWLDLEPGDVVMLNHRAWARLQGGAEGPRRRVERIEDLASERFAQADPRSDDVVLGGCIRLNPAGVGLLSEALPAVAHLRASATGHLGASVQRLYDELTSRRLGSAFAARQHAQLLLLEILRAYADQGSAPPGWMRVLTDERLAPAVRLMHAEPGRPWGLEELAAAAAMSRTSFATHFRAVAGVPPLTYLNHWRMLLAQQALRDRDARVGELAAELGYGSESAFSNAFKRVVGESPLRYRHRARAALVSPAP